MKFLKHKIGKFYPYSERTKWWHGVSGQTIQVWLWVIPRVIVLIPLAILSGIFSGLSISLDNITETLSEWMR